MNKPEYIVLHTAAWPGDPSSLDIDRSHRQDAGFREIGYHYVIRKNGIIEMGRHETEIGAHCRDSGMNRKSIGICLAGHHNNEDWSVAQKQSLAKLIGKLIAAYDIPVVKIIGHREAGSNKDCPGTRIDMNRYRQELKTRFEGMI